MAAKIFIVTGANTGIGYEIVRGLAKEQGNRVVLGCRNQEKGETAINNLVKDGISRENLDLLPVDISNKESVANFSSEFRKKYDRLDALINNAGVYLPERQQTIDGHEGTFGTNALGYYRVTQAFQDLLEKSAPSRIVNVASTYAGNVDLDDLNFTKRPYDQIGAYQQSKAANRMMSWHYADKLKSKNITVNALSPGHCGTQLNNFEGALSPAIGAKIGIWLASSKDAEGITGKFYNYDFKETECSFRDPQAIARLMQRFQEFDQK
eukprot:TRINITY_DN9990_c0_g1_i1.p1 TRINITY_DN9990_c0_g1~~TRINITY_DN9990_c0_g1_i1.p1  ORF type:complete len:266 (-),score=67.15 TRINITY_DN9990_c0_g1_i1:17-814(-)